MTFTIQQFVDKTLEKINENPDFQYHGPLAEVGYVDGRKCFYVATETKPACLFGQVFAELGVSEEDLENHEDESVVNLIAEFLPYDDSMARVNTWAESVQLLQDRNNTWKNALIDSPPVPVV